MTKACHQLFQENKNPSDSEIEEAFKSQIQKDCPKKMQELINSNGWENLWNAAYSIILEYFRNHRAAYIRKIKDATYMFLNLFSCKLNKFATSEEVRCWKESEKVKQARGNLLNYTCSRNLHEAGQAEISSSKVQERMNKWESNAIIQKWLKCEENLFEDNVMNYDNTEKNDDMQFNNVLMEESDIENESISIYNEDKRINDLNRTINMENTDSEDSSN
ncbi:unnamed protein product [Rhizophagus irregularis]|nr:unnamed protein product [Rhizophagus irregularis]